MKKIFLSTLTLTLTLTAFTSCGDWLNLEPENSVTADKYWMSEEQVSSAMTGIYCNWLGNSAAIWEQSEMRADMVVPGSTIKGDYTLVREGNITSTNSLASWAHYYSIINACNLLLDRSHIALENDPVYTVTQDSIYHAQARVIRAVMYFYLVRIWKDVPYITESFYDDTKDRYPSVTDRMTIINHLIADMEAVQKENFLPYSYSSSTSGRALNKGQVTMYMLKAFLADLYRFKGSYSTDLAESQAAYKKCLELCNTIIESGQFALVPFTKSNAADDSQVELKDAETKADSAFYKMTDVTAEDMFVSLYTTGNSNESIMELQEDNYNSSNFYNYVVGRRIYIPNVDLLNNSLFPSTEKEIASAYRYRDGRSDFAYGTMGSYLVIAKFAFSNFSTAFSTVSDYKKNVLVYRLAEIYLMKAEALTQIAMAEGNDQEKLLEAYRAVFKVRDRAGAVETTDLQINGGYMQDIYWNELREDLPIQLNPGDINGSAMEKFILDEEAREMAYEGRRWFDLLRNAERNNEGKGSCTGGSISYLVSTAASCTSTDKVSYISGQFKKQDFRYLPYPNNDVVLNDNLNQKPFWGRE